MENLSVCSLSKAGVPTSLDLVNDICTKQFALHLVMKIYWLARLPLQYGVASIRLLPDASFFLHKNSDFVPDKVISYSLRYL